MTTLIAMSGTSRPRHRKPEQEALVSAEEIDHSRADDSIEPVRPSLPTEQEAERNDDDHARRQHQPTPGFAGRPPAMASRVMSACRLFPSFPSCI